MNRVLSRILQASLLLALGACALPQGSRNQEVRLEDHYAGTRWELVRWTQADGQPVQIPLRRTGAAIALAFGAENGRQTASGFSGCNRYTVPYAVTPAGVSFGDSASTRMGCIRPQHDELERRYLEGLAQVTSASLDNPAWPSQLLLRLENGDSMLYHRVTGMSGEAAGTSRVVLVDSQRVPCVRQDAQSLCFRVRDSAAEPWRLWRGDIEGFVFEPGVSYRIRVNEQPAIGASPDLPAVRWKLEAILEQGR